MELELSDDTKIKYTVITEKGSTYYISFALKQIEGSVPSFIEQLADALGINEDEDKIIKIKRVIVINTDDNKEE